MQQGLRFASPPAYDLVTPMALYIFNLGCPYQIWDNVIVCLSNMSLELLIL